MKIINLVDDIRPVNFGIWSAAVITAPALLAKHGVTSELWYPAESAPATLPYLYGAKSVPLPSIQASEVKRMIEVNGLSSKDTIICTHGCWRYATRWGAAFRKAGFTWVYVPQGMLEPWSMSQKAFKKQIYFQLIERRLGLKATLVRAVGRPEFVNLVKLFPATTQLLPNSVLPKVVADRPTQPNELSTILFMARLHHKKGIIPLVKAWQQSSLNQSEAWQLLIAGPDDGELAELKTLLTAAGPDSNIKYLGAIYKDEKEAILTQAQFYILPTVSEGFPTSVVEAMQMGLIPIMSDGANFPEAFEANIGIKITQAIPDIVQGLEQAKSLTDHERQTYAVKAKHLIRDGYVVEQQAEKQYQCFEQLLKANQ